MIEVDNLYIQYDQLQVIKGLSGKFHQGKIYGIVGLNGSGKTSLFNALSGYRRPNRGTILLEGKSINSSHVNFLETSHFFYSYITGREYLDLFKATNNKFSIGDFEALFHLPLDQLIETYSTGMKKKLALLSILKKDKEVFLLDEPFNGLDLESNKILEIIIQTLKEKGKYLFVSSHIIEPLMKVCDEICLLKDGIFLKIYDQASFDTIDSDLFGTIGEEARLILKNLI